MARALHAILLVVGQRDKTSGKQQNNDAVLTFFFCCCCFASPIVIVIAVRFIIIYPYKRSTEPWRPGSVETPRRERPVRHVAEAEGRVTVPRSCAASAGRRLVKLAVTCAAAIASFVSVSLLVLS